MYHRGGGSVKKGGERMKCDDRHCDLEQKVGQLIEELKKNNCLRRDFEFLTQAEREERLEDFVERFIKNRG